MLSHFGAHSDARQRGMLLVGCFVLYFVWLMWVPLTNADEARYVEASREMIESGNYLIPHFNYEPRYQKPILIYWLQTSAMRVFGETEFAARIPSAVAATLLVLLVHGFLLHWLPRAVPVDDHLRLNARGVAFVTGGVLMTAPLLAFWARAATTDATLTLLISGCCLALLHADLLRATEPEPGSSARSVRNSYLAAAVCAGIGFLLKGPVGIAVPGLVWFVYHLLQRRLLAEARRVPWAGALGVFILIAAPWYIAVAVVDPIYMQHFFLHENVERFGGFNGGRELVLRIVQILFLSLTSIILLFPAAASLLRELHRPFGGKPDVADESVLPRMRRFAWVWVAGVIGLFSLSYTQLPSYVQNMIAGAMIALAIHLLGRLAPRSDARPDGREGHAAGLRPHLVETLLTVLGMAGWVGAMVWLLSRGSAEMPISNPSPLMRPPNGVPFPQPLTSVLGGVLVAVGLLLVVVPVLKRLRGRDGDAVAWTLGPWAVAMAIMLQGLTPIIIRSSEAPTVEVATYLRELPDAYTVLLWVEREADSTVYYSQRRVELRMKAKDDFPTTIRKALAGPGPVVLVADGQWAREAPQYANIEVLRRFGGTVVAMLRPPGSLSRDACGGPPL